MLNLVVSLQVPSLFERVLLSDKAASEKEMSAGLPQLGSRLRKSWEPSVGLHTKVVLVKKTSFVIPQILLLVFLLLLVLLF